jgi:hypothetical protein
MADVAVRATRSTHSFIPLYIDRLVAFCAIIPYALVALLLRFVMARVFFLSGQAKVEGVSIPFSFHDLNLPVILPGKVSDATLQVLRPSGPPSPSRRP